LAALQNSYDARGWTLEPFYFYDPYETNPKPVCELSTGGIGGGGGSRTRVREGLLWEPTCVADSVFSAAAVGTGKSDCDLARLISAWAPDRSLAPISQNDAHSPACEPTGWSGRLIN